MTTNLRNPHYAPEVSVKVSLLNFFVTPEGLEEQLLGTVVTQERPDLANLKSQLVVSNAKMKKELKDIEDKILQMLSNSQGNILDDEELINTLAQSKVGARQPAALVIPSCSIHDYLPPCYKATEKLLVVSEIQSAVGPCQSSFTTHASCGMRNGV
jgi:hypothetical protein